MSHKEVIRKSQIKVTDMSHKKISHRNKSQT